MGKYIIDSHISFVYALWKSLCIIIPIVILLSGCANMLDSGEGISDYYSVQKEIGEIADSVIDAVGKGDKQTLYDMFSMENKNNRDIMSELDKMFVEVNWQCFSFDDVKGCLDGEGKDLRDGKLTRYSYGYKIEGITDDNGNKYLISYGYTAVDEEHTNYIGLCQLSIYMVEYTDEWNYNVLEEHTVGDLTLHRR